jgi:hypothetical protein
MEAGMLSSTARSFVESWLAFGAPILKTQSEHLSLSLLFPQLQQLQSTHTLLRSCSIAQRPFCYMLPQPAQYSLAISFAGIICSNLRLSLGKFLNTHLKLG